MAKTKARGRLLDEVNFEDMNTAVRDWRAPDLNEVAAVVAASKEIFIDHETSGLRWYDKDRIVGTGIRAAGRSWYLPVRHRGEGNIPESAYLDFLRSIRDKRIVNIRTKFDVHMSRADGVDLEAQGNTFGDVAHYAALLDDHRRKFNQEELVEDYLLDKSLPPHATAKVKEAKGFALDMSRVADIPPGLVAFRACHDVEMVDRLQSVMWPMMDAQGLHTVRELEDSIIPVVVEMEHNGAPIDVETLAKWNVEAEAELKQALYDIYKLTGVRLATPDTRNDLVKLFATLNIPIPIGKDEYGNDAESFADALLEPLERHESERVRKTISRLRAAKQIASVLAKFLRKYLRDTTLDGKLRYELHQLPFEKEEGGNGGAVSGRFSSAAMTYYDERGVQVKYGGNIQQVFGVTSQKKTKHYTSKWIIRRLFKPGKDLGNDAVWFCADARQIEYRLFAHFANSPKILESYAKNPLVDYHELVQRLILELANRELTRTHTKNVNFAQVFGAGIRKLAAQLGVPAHEIPAFGTKVTAESGGPEFQKAFKLSETYHQMFPEVRPLLELASHLAMPGHDECRAACRRLSREGYPHRGHVMTLLGRRARFNHGDRFYSALNRVIQGTAADINKRVLIEVHKNRHALGFLPRFTVHDELNGDLACPERQALMEQILNTQYYDLRVPILWDTGIGPNWADAKE